MRKNKDDKESKNSIFLGRINPTGEYEEVKVSETDTSAVEITYNLEDPIRNDIFNYLLSYGVK